MFSHPLGSKSLPNLILKKVIVWISDTYLTWRPVDCNGCPLHWSSLLFHSSRRPLRSRVTAETGADWIQPYAVRYSARTTWGLQLARGRTFSVSEQYWPVCLVSGLLGNLLAMSSNDLFLSATSGHWSCRWGNATAVSPISHPLRHWRVVDHRSGSWSKPKLIPVVVIPYWSEPTRHRVRAVTQWNPRTMSGHLELDLKREEKEGEEEEWLVLSMTTSRPSLAGYRSVPSLDLKMSETQRLVSHEIVITERTERVRD